MQVFKRSFSLFFFCYFQNFPSSLLFQSFFLPSLLCVLLSSLGFPQVPWSPLESPRVPLSSLKFFRVIFSFFEFSWIPLSSREFLWGLLKALFWPPSAPFFTGKLMWKKGVLRMWFDPLVFLMLRHSSFYEHFHTHTLSILVLNTEFVRSHV